MNGEGFAWLAWQRLRYGIHGYALCGIECATCCDDWARGER